MHAKPSKLHTKSKCWKNELSFLRELRSSLGCLLLELRTHRSNHLGKVLGVATGPGDVHGHLEGGFYSDPRGVVIDFLHQDRQILSPRKPMS